MGMTHRERIRIASEANQRALDKATWVEDEPRSLLRSRVR